MLTLLHLTGGLPVLAQSTNHVAPLLHYTLTIDSTDLSGYRVSIQISHAPHRFRLAMATHHEYDDRFWRWVTDFRVEGSAAFFREDSAVWAVTTAGGQVTVTYRIRLPASGAVHFAHRPYLGPNGGLVGDLHSFMYLVEDDHLPCRVTLRLPPDWVAATGLDRVQTAPMEFTASSEPMLLDAPILVGRLHSWVFTVNGAPHQASYLPVGAAPGLDTVALVNAIRKIVRGCADLFGGSPFHHYSFLLEEGRVGALEHANSVTIGIPTSSLAAGAQDLYEEFAHEYFHTWNLMSIRPSSYTGLNYGPQQQSPGLWFSEGVTMFYADLICRRMGLRVEDSSRPAHLAALIRRYYENTGNTVFPPSMVSLAANALPGPLGDYSASTHVQGELLGVCLDLLIRDGTDDQHSLDDVMRLMYRRFGGRRPFRDSDVEEAVRSVCHCPDAHSFFVYHLYQGKPIDFNRWLRPVGLRLETGSQPAMSARGQPLPDTRVYAWQAPGDTQLRIGIENPNSCWAKAGLHTGDTITGINGRPIQVRQDLQTVVSTLHTGDTVRMEVRRGPRTDVVAVYIGGYPVPLIHLIEDPAAGAKQRRLLEQWREGLSNRKSLPG